MAGYTLKMADYTLKAEEMVGCTLKAGGDGWLHAEGGGDGRLHAEGWRRWPATR